MGGPASLLLWRARPRSAQQKGANPELLVFKRDINVRELYLFVIPIRSIRATSCVVEINTCMIKLELLLLTRALFSQYFL